MNIRIIEDSCIKVFDNEEPIAPYVHVKTFKFNFIGIRIRTNWFIPVIGGICGIPVYVKEVL